jgi:hypothetical protein
MSASVAASLTDSKICSAPIPGEISVAGSLAAEEESGEPARSVGTRTEEVSVAALLMVDEDSNELTRPICYTPVSVAVSAANDISRSQDERANIEQIVHNALQKMSVAAEVITEVNTDDEHHRPRPTYFRKATRLLFRKKKEG